MRLPYLVLLLGNAVYGTAYATARVTVESVPPVTLAALRLVLASLALLPFYRRPKLGGRLSPGDRGAWSAWACSASPPPTH